VISDSTVSLRPSGIARYFSAAFMAVWLAGWLAGEVFAIAVLGGIAAAVGGLLREPPAWITDFATSGPLAFVVLFLLVWLTFWTIGGLAAFTHLLRSLSGEDSITLTASGVELVRRAGPFRARYLFERPAIRRIRLRPSDKALVADTERGTRVLTDFGTPLEREAVRTWLIGHVGLTGVIADPGGAVPATWETTADGDRTHLRKIRPRARVIRSIVAWAVTAAVASAWSASRTADTSAGNPAALALTALLACGAALSTWGRREWIVRRGELIFHWSFGPSDGEQSFTVARLDVTQETDSDNDSRYELLVLSGDDRRVVHSQLHDAAEVVDLGHWLAGRTGFPLVLPRELRPTDTAQPRSHEPAGA
jgi:hypothetical protein